jgi:signal transduction histidine kinase
MVAPVRAETPARSDTSADPVNILLVDDKPSRLLTYRTILNDLEENLIEASSGTEALKLLMEHEFALILLDINMPGLDGFETANLIHEHPRFENTPIIFITAVNLSDLDRMRGYKLGAVDYVMVPIIPEILRSKVVVLAELHRKRRDLELANRHLATANEALQAEKARELGALNESLRLANIELANRNAQLQGEVAERQRAEARLMDQDRRKDEFLAMLAHELRNPLSSVSNAISVLKLTSSTHAPLHESMARQMGLLVRLIDDLLDVARISRGKLILKQGLTTINAIVDSAVETVAPMFENSRHVLNIVRPPADIALHADRERLSQVFSNLLSNAAKYSNPETVVDVMFNATDDRIEISVVDRGIGLTPEQQNWIFELFAQVDTTLERSRGGLGIGLTLARHIVEMHDGALRVASDGPGKGSRFTVSLPRHVILTESVPEKPTAGENPYPCRALVVDDNIDSADTLVTILQLLGHEAQCLNDPHRVADVVADFMPDVVFLDIGMPGLSGYDVARNLRANADRTKLVLVALTGWGQSEDRRRTAEAGFDHHLVKPAELESIQRICREVALRARRHA